MLSSAKRFWGKSVEIFVFMKTKIVLWVFASVFISDSVMKMLNSLVRKTKP